mgnify:CR=1 FL=1
MNKKILGLWLIAIGLGSLIGTIFFAQKVCATGNNAVIVCVTPTPTIALTPTNLPMPTPTEMPVVLPTSFLTVAPTIVSATPTIGEKYVEKIIEKIIEKERKEEVALPQLAPETGHAK